MRKLLLGASLTASLLCAACSSTQLTAAEQQANAALNTVATACAGAEAAEQAAAAATNGGAKNTVTEINTDYLQPACGTSQAIIAIAQNPTTVTWLNGIVADLNAAAGQSSGSSAPAAASPSSRAALRARAA